MPRLRVPALDDLKPEQRAVWARTLAGRRGVVPANVRVWLLSPDLASRAQALGEFLRYNTTLHVRQAELAILVVARRWSAQYEWGVHAVEAVRAGVSAEVIAAIRERRPPAFDDATDRAVFELASALVVDGRVSDETYRTAVADLGERATVELVGLVGYYTMVAFTLNTFEVAPPPGAPVLD
ncbi:MAG TPA: carboxymuconolactone decarboxylase family protein [Vicinamibacterales bacterium]|nr:carboxymuconolactone decarboxylase family protein [Vicinamibacterales bacterium]